MKKVCWPYFDPEFDSLRERIYGPNCRVCIDNKSLEDCTVVKVDSVNKQGLLLEVVQVLTDKNLTISKGYISSDGGWFMDVFHVKDEHGSKLTDQRVINYIQQAIGATRENPKVKARASKLFESEHHSGLTAIEMIGADRPGLFSEISAALTDLHCNIVEAHAWSHNSRLACVAYISNEFIGTPMDQHRLTIIEDYLTAVLRADSNIRSPSSELEWCTNQQEAKTAAGLPRGEGTMTSVERRLHQLMLSVCDFDSPSWLPVGSTRTGMAMGLESHDNYSDDEEEWMRKASVSIESCEEKGYSIVKVECKDRPRLMFDTVCTLTDLQYLIFHASVDSQKGFAFQEYFIRHVDGCALNTEGEKERIVKCLGAAIERRVCEGVRLELSANNRVGLLSDITRVLRENGLAVVRADVVTEGEKVVNAFYVRDISGNDVGMEFVESMKREMGPIDLDVKNIIEKPLMHISPERSRFSNIGDMLKSQIERFSQNFVTIK